MISYLKAFYLVIIIAFLFLSPAKADQVVPTDRVITHVNIRQLPGSQSDIISILNKNESAQLIESIPYWHKIKLNNEIEGYVSKAWTQVIQNGTNSLHTGKEDLVIGSWNIKWFGKSKDDIHDYPRMADIIKKIDVLAIQEVCGEYYIEHLNKLINSLSDIGFKYTYLVSDNTGYLNNPDKNNETAPKKDYLERYCFMWDADRIELVNCSDGYIFVSEPRLNNETFRQVPIYTDFRVIDGKGFDFRILTVHTVYNEKLNQVRRGELQFLDNWIISQVNNPENSEKNIIVIGDFNANPDGQPHHFDDIITGTDKYRVLMNEPLVAGEPPLRTTVQQSDNPALHYFEKPVYDHALVSNETSYALPNRPMTRTGNDLGIIEFDQEEYWQTLCDWNLMIKAMSDHRPIWFKMDYMAQDMD